jgi:hypothetical protein
MPAHHLDESITSRTYAYLPCGREHRQVRFTTAVLLDASPAPAPRRTMQALEERVDERCFADAGVARHEDEPSRPIARALERRAQFGKLGGAPHKRRGPHLDHLGTSRIDARLQRNVARSDFDLEAVAAPDDRLDDACAENLPERANVRPEHALAHHDFAPDRLDELLVRDEPLWMLREVAQNGEGLSAEAQLRPVLPEPFFVQIELKRRK